MNNEEYNEYIDELRLHGTRELAEEVYRLEKENKRLKKEKKKLSNDLADAILFNQKRCEQNKELQQRIDNAIELIKECQLGVDSMDRPVMLLDQIEGRDLLKILGGD